MLILKNINILKSNNSLKFFYTFSYKEKKIYNPNFLNIDFLNQDLYFIENKNLEENFLDFLNQDLDFLENKNLEENFLDFFYSNSKKKDFYSFEFKETTSSKISLDYKTGSWPEKNFDSEQSESESESG
jgi:hypothetical protein